MTTESLFSESRKIYVPLDDLEEMIMIYLEEKGYIADNEVLLDIDLGLEINSKGLATIDAEVTWVDG